MSDQTPDPVPREYSPPDSASMRSWQNTVDALRLLLAQRHLYSRSKRWLSLRIIGMLVITLVAPVVSVLWTEIAVVAGAVAGLWIFVGRTVLIQLEKRTSTQAAAVQEMFDIQLFGMPSLGHRTPSPSLEEISTIAGDDQDIIAAATNQELLDWYEIEPFRNSLVTVAICQRANASYSDRLLRSHANVWISLVAVWATLLIIAAIWYELSLSVFVLGIVLPLLPAFLDAVEYWYGIRRAAADRRDLVVGIESKLEKGPHELDGQDVLVWQSRFYNLRRDVPQVPDFLYRLQRKKNEAAMRSAANQLSLRAERDSEDG